MSILSGKKKSCGEAFVLRNAYDVSASCTRGENGEEPWSMRVSGGWECSLLRAAVIFGGICAAFCLFRKLGRLLRERRLLRDWKHRLETKAARRRASAAEKTAANVEKNISTVGKNISAVEKNIANVEKSISAAEKSREKNDCRKNPARDAGCGCAE